MIKKLVGKPVLIDEDRWQIVGETDDGRLIEVTLLRDVMKAHNFQEPNLEAANAVPAVGVRVIRGD